MDVKKASTKELKEYVQRINAKMKELGYSQRSLQRVNTVWDKLLLYAEKHGSNNIDSAYRQAFIDDVYGYKMSDDTTMYEVSRSLNILFDFIHYGVIFQQRLNTGQGFSPGFKDVFEGFLKKEAGRGLTEGTLKSFRSRLFKLEHFFCQFEIIKFGDVSSDVLLIFVESLASYSASSTSAYIRMIRCVCSYAYEMGWHEMDLSTVLPHVKNVRQQRLPATFSSDETQKILDSIDRDNPIGKRTYAMVLLAARLGLRISDIRGLQFSSIDWSNKMLHIVQKKTGKLVELPLLEDVGWAIIDYLKNGRPQSDCKFVFVRHSPPYCELTGSSHIIATQMRKAGINSPSNRRVGMHALRHGLATSMLENGVSLPVISQTLGHSDIQNTEIYLRIGISQLRQCALEVEL